MKVQIWLSNASLLLSIASGWINNVLPIREINFYGQVFSRRSLSAQNNIQRVRVKTHVVTLCAATLEEAILRIEL